MRKLKEETGAALLTVLIALMIITMMLFEFQYGSMVERKLAYNDLNQIQAYYLAKSGARLGMLRVALYAQIAKNPSLQNLTRGANIQSYLDMIWQLPLPPFPPDVAEMTEYTKADRDAAQEFLNQTKISIGKSVHTIRTETDKINLNFLQVPKELREERVEFRSNPDTLFEHVGLTLVNLIQSFIDESEDPYAEYGNLNPEEVVYSIMDWVNPGTYSYSGGSKDAFYEEQNPPYRAKRNRFYTLEELRMVKGMTPNLFRKLRKHVTVYAFDGKININTASDQILKALYTDFTEEDLKDIATKKEELGGWKSEKQFVDFVSKTLGRSGFEELYDDPKEYPFTTDSTSFVIEASGMIRKSASVIQRNITVAMALTTGEGGNAGSGGFKVNQNIRTREECLQQPNHYWYSYAGLQQCREKPATEQACIDHGGTPQPTNGRFCCNITHHGLQCLTDRDKNARKTADKLKVLYWAES